MTMTLSWHRWARRMRESRLTLPAVAAALSLLAAVIWVHGFNRSLLDESGGAASRVTRQAAVIDDHERMLRSMLALHDSLVLSAARGQADAEVGRRLGEFNEALEATAARLSNTPELPVTPTSRDTFVMLRNLFRVFQSLDDDIHKGRPISAAMLARSFDAINQVLSFGRELRAREWQEVRQQQAAIVALRVRLLWLMNLLCLSMALSVGLVAYGIQWGLRSARARREVDIARAQAALAGQQADAAGRDKSRFLGMLSHELLTPLQSIVSSMDIIESKGRVEASDAVFLRLREGARALRARMSDLVDFAKMSSGRLAISARKFRVDRLIEAVIADHEEALLRKDLDIHWELHPSLQEPVITDPRRVRQILDNLLSNAIKYTERGGITLDLRIDADQGKLKMEVRDTGVGIEPQLLHSIFDPFFRIAGSAHLADGSGLGLAVVCSLVDLLRGEIQVDSRVGEGTRFRVEVPVAQAAEPGTAPLQPADLRSGVSVLIVDDAHDARAVVADVLRGLGCVPSEAATVKEALRALSETAFAMVLLDLDLPDGSGFDVIRSVRSGNGPNRGTHFVMLSAAHIEHEDSSLFDARADKPVLGPQLKELLQAALSADTGAGERPQDPAPL